MVASKKVKKIKQKEMPRGKVIVEGGNPEQYYSQNPAWTFENSDQEMWAFTQEHIGDLLWSEIIPRLKALESKTWNEILVYDKRYNHSLTMDSLNKIARDRLTQKFIEGESLISLRITGKHRLYGYMTNGIFNILWFDDNHGDNDTCVCRSSLRHT